MTTLPARFDELRDLLIELTDGELDAPGRDRLRDLLIADDEAAGYYAQFMSVHAGLLFEPAAAVVMPSAQHASLQRATEPAPRQLKFPISNLNLAAAAAALLLAAAALAIWLGLFNRQSAIDNRQSPSAPIATVLDTTGGTLIVNDNPAAAGADFATGSISLDAGTAEFRLDNGVSVSLRGATQLTLHDPMTATLALGTAEFYCPANAHGYTIKLPQGSRIVDLGTQFLVTLDPQGVASVAVLEGRVRIHRDHETNPAGVEVDAGSVVVVDHAAEHDAFVRPAPRTMRPVALRNATSDFDQTAGEGFPVAATIDGSFGPRNGWGFYPQADRPHWAVWQTASELILPRTVEVRLHFLYSSNESAMLRRFRISSTGDDRDAPDRDRPNSESEDADWTVLVPAEVEVSGGADAVVLDDGSIRTTPRKVVETSTQTAVVRVICPTRAQRITGLRLEVLAEPTVGHQSDGNAVLTEIELIADAPVIPGDTVADPSAATDE